jgi:choline dehydrogenase-like flavoprotein
MEEHIMAGKFSDFDGDAIAEMPVSSPWGLGMLHPSTSALNSHCQAHDCKNLFVTDGAPFVSQADKNPTWTILALSWRTSDYIARQRKQGAL